MPRHCACLFFSLLLRHSLREVISLSRRSSSPTSSTYDQPLLHFGAQCIVLVYDSHGMEHKEQNSIVKCLLVINYEKRLLRLRLNLFWFSLATYALISASNDQTNINSHKLASCDSEFLSHSAKMLKYLF